MKLEVGMYVRHKPLMGRKYAKINKIKEIEEQKNCLHIWLEDKDLITEKHLIKASHNIIDLIEETDYIRIITSAYFEPVYYSYGKLVIRDDIPIENYSNDFVREVITKEQMEAMAYKVV